MKKTRFIIPSIILLATVILLCCLCIHGWREGNYARRMTSLSFIKYLVLTAKDCDNIKGIPAPVMRKNGKKISWREYVVSVHADSISGDLKTFFHPDDEKISCTFIVAVHGKRTLWGDDFRNKIKVGTYEKKEFPPEELDKILLIEIPDNNIAWDSLRDYSVEEVLNLWPSRNFSRGFFQKRGLCYVTLHGKIGRISDFRSKDEFQKMIEFSDEEMVCLSALWSITEKRQSKHRNR
jgi:hypothetical protein